MWVCVWVFGCMRVCREIFVFYCVCMSDIYVSECACVSACIDICIQRCDYLSDIVMLCVYVDIRLEYLLSFAQEYLIVRLDLPDYARERFWFCLLDDFYLFTLLP